MLVVGHRGWPSPAHPENTLAAVTAALDAGADGAEVDVRLTADGVAVCCHDDDLRRVGADVPSVRRSTWEQLRDVRLPGGHRVPLLADVAAAVAGRGLLVLDLKPDLRVQAVVRAGLGALRAAGVADDDVVASSFDPRLLDALAARRPGLPRAALLDVGEPLEPGLTRARLRRDAAVHLPLSTLLAQPAAALAGGVPVRVWTVNRLADARLCELVGVEGVITDLPAELTAARDLAARRLAGAA